MEYMAAQMDRQIEGAQLRYDAAIEDGLQPAFPVADYDHQIFQPATVEESKRQLSGIQLGLERLTGMPADDFFVSKEMMWGTEQEPFARMAYEEKTGLIVQECGFICLTDFMAGCSVDGFIEFEGRKGVWEAKCPKSSTHLGYLEADRLPPEHAPQILHNMWATDAEFADFVSFDPRMPEHLQLFIHRVERDEKAIADYEAEVVDFLLGVDAMVLRLMEKAA